MERYAEWVAGLLQGDLGTSATGRPVGELLAERIGNSALLAAATVAVLVPCSLALGVATGLRRGTATDRAASTGMLLAAVPEFVVAGGLVRVFAAGLGWIPAVSLVPVGSSPLSVPEVLVLPVVSLSLLGSPTPTPTATPTTVRSPPSAAPRS